MTSVETPPGGSEKPPRVDTETVIEIASGIHVIPDHRVPLVPNIGVILGDSGALIVDTGMGPKNGEMVLAAAKQIAGNRRLYLTMTHFHPEHAFGAQVFEPHATILYNKRQLDDLHAKGDTYLELFHTFGDHVSEYLQGVEFVDPHVAYESAVELDLGGRKVSMWATGQAHTLGDQIISIPDEQVLFVGDLIETRVFAIFPYFPPDDTDVSGSRWIDVLGAIEKLDPEVIVPGHGEIRDVRGATDAREYISMLRRETFSRADKGMGVDTIVDELVDKIRLSRPDWDSPEWIEFGIRCFFDEHAEQHSR